MISARLGAATSCHDLKALAAAAAALSTSHLSDFWNVLTSSQVSAGLLFSKVLPVTEATHSPLMKSLYSTVAILVDFAVALAAGLDKTNPPHHVPTKRRPVSDLR
jgi:hypothetical protein